MKGSSTVPFAQSWKGVGKETSANSYQCYPTTWVDKYGDSLLRFALSHVRHRETAEDLVQETFLAALKSRHSFNGGSSEKTWLVSILKHKAIDHFRANKRWKAFDDFSESLNEDSGVVETPSGQSASSSLRGPHEQPNAKVSEIWKIDPAHCAQQKAFWCILHQCLSKLSPRVASAFALREIEQLDAKEICENLNISEGNLWVMLHRARQCLKECLESNWRKKVA